MMGMKPDEIPAVPVVVLNICVQGAAKVDCVTVWFFATNTKLMVSFTLAVMLFGLYVRVPLAPTMIMCVVVVALVPVVPLTWPKTTAGTTARTAAMVEKRILRIFVI